MHFILHNGRMAIKRIMTMMTLYGSGQSRSFRALWALEESGLVFEYRHIKIGDEDEGGSRHPSYLALNPQGKAPTLVHEDLTLTESAAIINYIASLVPEKRLVPEDKIQRAKYDEVCFFVLSDLEQPLWTIGKHKFVLPREYRIPGIMNTAKWEFRRSEEALLKYFDENEFVMGDQFTGADILIGQTLTWAKRLEVKIPQQLVEYRDALYQRSACQRALEKVKP